MSIRRALPTLMALAVALTACDSATGPDPELAEAVAGTYTLVAVNGADLPFTNYTGDDYTEYFLGGTITLERSGAFTLTMDQHRTGPQRDERTTGTTDGTWSGTVDRLQFQFTGSSPAFYGAVDGNVLEFVNHEDTFRYER